METDADAAGGLVNVNNVIMIRAISHGSTGLEPGTPVRWTADVTVGKAIGPGKVKPGHTPCA